MRKRNKLGVIHIILLIFMLIFGLSYKRIMMNKRWKSHHLQTRRIYLQGLIRLFFLGLFLSYSIHPLYTQPSFIPKGADIGIDHIFESDDNMIGGGVAFFDYNQDGCEDIYLTGGLGTDKLYQNNGNGTFSDVSIAAGIGFTSEVNTLAVATGDIDNDGYRDIFIGTSDRFRNILLKNKGDGTFEDISTSSGIDKEKSWSTSITFADINLDGFLDIYIGNYIEINRATYGQDGNINGFNHECYANFLYLNNGKEEEIKFTEVSAEYGVDDLGCALASVFTDYDQDGDVDIFLANDFGEWVIPNKLFQNEYPQPFFSDVSVRSRLDAPMYGMGIAVGDFDQDLDLDYYVTNLGRNGLFMNDNDGTFQDVTAVAGVEDALASPTSLSVGWGTAFVDLDLDTDLDLLVTNGYIPAVDFIFNEVSSPDRIFLNQGSYSFESYGQQAGSADTSISRGMAYSDYDNDGDIDYLIVPIQTETSPNPPKSVILYQNTLSTSSNWLKVKLTGTLSNRDAYGAQLKIKVGDIQWLQEINGGSSHASQHSSLAHFGLGEANQVDSLWVIWPGGNQQLLTQIAANQILQIIENPDDFLTNVSSPFSPIQDFVITPNPFQHTFSIHYSLSIPTEVKVDLYNDLGQHLLTLQEEQTGIGYHQLSLHKGELVPGIYMLRIQAGNRIIIKKILKTP